MRFLILLAFAASPVIAQDYRTEIIADLNGDGMPDRAELVEIPKGGDATLNIYDGGTRLVVNAPALVWVGGAGQQPELTITDHGSLQVHAMNISIGRNKWHEVLTIAFRQGQYKVAGYTYSWYDGLNMDDQGECDVNLLTGKGILSLGMDWTKSSFTTKTRAMPVQEWPREVLKDCRIGRN